MDNLESRGSIIPPGNADIALLLTSFPQVSEYDCGVELDQLVASGLNEIARRENKTVNDIAKEACYTYFRFYFAMEGREESDDG